MAKPTKEQIEALARKLWRTRWNGRDMIDAEWDRASPELRASWRHVARLAVTEIGRMMPLLPAPKRNPLRDLHAATAAAMFAKASKGNRKPKSCRLVKGRVVCK